ncbi:LysR family transcriptional regulator [Kitasatospora atroaurantiaca]|uniref:DNA-binding transcriptional LysR family regulator n=1 Tax=Kitasatospora atroaurantiaca TaxID=285545 RepID=A0A561EVZ5_9ACTN|nr:LysR family transcriptional regulator [Kitasatospora atroaurantiaca]TWE19778.1 DNA-binding transcriptional LysR family regulator [Kitasatospora atroaurantiaca]
MMDLGRLRALHAVAVHGSVGGAAAALGFTPSAVSQQISKLERETRTVLLERQGRGVVLTDAARELADTAQRVLALVEQAEVTLEEQRGQAVGRLLVAAFATGARGLLPRALADLRERCPELDVRLLETDPYLAAELVARGEVDLALVQDWPTVPLPVQDGLSRMDLGSDPVDLLLRAEHPLAALAVVPVARLCGQRWISVPPGNICHDWLVRTMREAGEEPDVVYQVGEFETQIALIEAGLGIGLVPRLGRGPLPPGVVARPVVPEPARRVFTLWRTQASRRPAITAALEAMRERWRER